MAFSGFLIKGIQGEIEGLTLGPLTFWVCLAGHCFHPTVGHTGGHYFHLTLRRKGNRGR